MSGNDERIESLFIQREKLNERINEMVKSIFKYETVLRFPRCPRSFGGGLYIPAMLTILGGISEDDLSVIGNMSESFHGSGFGYTPDYELFKSIEAFLKEKGYLVDVNVGSIESKYLDIK